VSVLVNEVHRNHHTGEVMSDGACHTSRATHPRRSFAAVTKVRGGVGEIDGDHGNITRRRNSYRYRNPPPPQNARRRSRARPRQKVTWHVVDPTSVHRRQDRVEDGQRYITFDIIAPRRGGDTKSAYTVGSSRYECFDSGSAQWTSTSPADLPKPDQQRGGTVSLSLVPLGPRATGQLHPRVTGAITRHQLKPPPGPGPDPVGCDAPPCGVFRLACR